MHLKNRTSRGIVTTRNCMIAFVLPAALFFFLFSCRGGDNNIPGDFDFGSISGDVYANTYFGMHIPIPGNMQVLSHAMMDSITNSGLAVITDDPVKKKAMEDARATSAQLLSIINSNDSVFPYSLLCVAENLHDAPEITNGKIYLENTKTSLSGTNLSYTFPREIYKVSVGGKEFYILETQVQIYDNTLYQEYFSTVMKGYELSFILSYKNEDQHVQLSDIIGTVRFD